MADPITLIALTAFIVKHAPSWYTSLRGTLLDKSREVAIDKGKELAVARGGRFVQRVFHLDEKEQLRHLEQALKNATERGLATFDTLTERDQYKDIVHTLSQDGPQGEVLRQEVMHLFTLAEQPDFAVLSETYNQRQRFFNAAHQDIDVAPYLNSFFNALIGELYADPYFRAQLSDVLQQRAVTSMQRSLLNIVCVLKSIEESLDDSYKTEDFAHDVADYTAHIERTMRNLKIVGVVPKDQNADPEISGIFVPLRVASNDRITSSQQFPDALVAALEEYPSLVILGGPGSGKSTATKHLAWSHAAANQSVLTLTHAPLLSGNPLPLRIELRRLNEERKRENYDFLSFVTEVLLKREGVEINPQMFKELLTRRCMLLLFDGLDEVATLDERLGLVGEIEHFALCYPGNRVLVTSRPVGYDLARISHPLFVHAQVQNFNDKQIQQFLENWYTAVLRLSPLPQRDQEEMALLLTALKENPRLHKLAENPLLLTVITVLHRYERLPDRRVLVYDRCAELLLETWAKLRGTDKRWKDMKMIKEEQYTCVAYLAFLLHERSQEEIASNGKKGEDITVDVTSRFLRKHVEEFLKKRELIVGIAEQQNEAKRFIELVQEEAGLIVERGSDENGEGLYSFVHRTFQEYFAAVDVYERYQQQEDPDIISTFLSEHLHDPHWSEVILLLLGKLKSRPVTNQLRQILEGKIKSRRSSYTEIVQQDLFFVCDCLIEEIKVENTLVEMVVSALKDVVKCPRFSSQQKKALQYLGKLMQTRQYAGRGREELIFFAMKDNLPALTVRLEAAKTLYLYSAALSEEWLLADRVMKTLLQRPDLSVDQIVQTTVSFYQSSPQDVKAQQLLGTSLLTSLLQRPELSADQVRQLAEILYQSSSPDAEAKQLATSLFTSLLQRPELSVDQVFQTAMSLYRSSSPDSEAKQLATFLLTSLLQHPDLSADQACQAIVFLYISNFQVSEALQLATFLLTSLLKRPDLSIDQTRQTAEVLYMITPDSNTQQLAASLLTSLLQRPDLSIDQTFQTAVSLYRSSSPDSNAQKLATFLLTPSLLQHPDLSVDQAFQTAVSLYQSSSPDSNAQKLATSRLASLLQYPDLSVDQACKATVLLYQSSSPDAEAKQLATSLLLILLSHSEGSTDNIDVYHILREMVPQFHKLSLITIPHSSDL